MYFNFVIHTIFFITIIFFTTGQITAESLKDINTTIKKLNYNLILVLIKLTAINTYITKNAHKNKPFLNTIISNTTNPNKAVKYIFK